MAFIAKQRYKLDIAPRGGWVIVYASKHDDGAREIEFEITNQGRAFSIPALINVSVQGIKSNGSYFSHSCSYSGNIVTMALADDMTDIIGKSICVLKFTNSSQQKLATAKFVLNVDTDSSSEGIIIDTDAEEIFNQMLNEIRAQAASVSADIAELQSMVGSPLVASTASGMTNHNKIYVYTGSESGYTNGNWYYWNGSAWTSGGVYNAVAIETDKTLSVENMPADSWVVGNKITLLKENKKKISFDLIADEYVKSDGTFEAYAGWSRTDYIDVSTQYEILVSNPYRATNYCHFYDVDKNPIGTNFNLAIGENIVETNGASYVCISNNTGSINQGKLKIYFHNTDASLSIPGDNADAAATGRTLAEISRSIVSANKKIDVSKLNCEVFDWSLFGTDTYPFGWRTGRYAERDGSAGTQTFYIRTLDTIDIVKTVDGASYLEITAPNGYSVSVSEYDANDGTFIANYGTADSRIETAEQSITLSVTEGHNYKFTIGRFANNDSGTYITNENFIKTIVLKIYWELDYGAIHDYYFPYIQNRADEINRISRTISEKSFSFIFITDYHSLRNAKQSKKLINYICKNTGISTVIFGGDAFQNYRLLTQSMREVSKVYSILANAGERRFLAVYGNHEWNDTENQINTLSGVKQITIKGIYDAESMNIYGNYYIDDSLTETRVYFLTSNISASIPWESIMWLGGQLNAIPASWNAMVICHCGLLSDASGNVYQKNTYMNVSKLLGAYKSHTTTTLTDSTGGERGTFDYTQSTGDVICYICGHVHEDLQILKADDQNGVLAFSTTGDLYKQANGAHYTFVDENGNTITRNVGTIYEQAFDVIQIDTVNKKIYCTRIGAGVDREFDF